MFVNKLTTCWVADEPRWAYTNHWCREVYMKQTILNHLPFFYNGVCLLFTHLWLKQHSGLLKVMEDCGERARWWALNFYGQLLFRHRKGLHGSTLLRSLVPPSSCSASKFSHSRVFFSSRMGFCGERKYEKTSKNKQNLLLFGGGNLNLRGYYPPPKALKKSLSHSIMLHNGKTVAIRKYKIQL